MINRNEWEREKDTQNQVSQGAFPLKKNNQIFITTNKSVGGYNISCQF